MQEIKDTLRATVRISYDGKVQKTFRGPKAEERFANEVRVLQYLAAKNCPFVPKLLEFQPDTLSISTTSCGTRVDRIDDERLKELFGELEQYGVRHDDPEVRNVTYRQTDGRFCLIDFEFATILDEAQPPAMTHHAPETNAAASLRWSGVTDRGKIRKNNEDAFVALCFDAREFHYLGKVGEASLGHTDFAFAVSDGIGGNKAGEFASRVAVEKITRLLPKSYRQSAEGLEVGFADVLSELYDQIHKALNFLGSDKETAGMGATLSLCWFTPGWMYFAHVGDSRIYYLSAAEGGMKQLSHDDTHVGWLYRNAKISEYEARTHPARNRLQKALGAGHQFVDPQVGSVAYAKGDLFLVCSDGVIDGLYDNQVLEVLRPALGTGAGSNPALRLVEAALERSGRDNTTALVIEAV